MKLDYFNQTYQLTDKDLVETFLVDNNVSNYSPLKKNYSPYWIRYEVHKIDRKSGLTERYGSQFRLPVEVSTGTFRPNFIIGSDWETGEYLIRWKYKDSSYSDTVFRDRSFIVLTAGVQNSSISIVKSYLDLPAKITVVD